jgi:hypothetical protein
MLFHVKFPNEVFSNITKDPTGTSGLSGNTPLALGEYLVKYEAYTLAISAIEKI